MLRSVFILLMLMSIISRAEEGWISTSEEWITVHHHQEDAENVQAILDAVYFTYPNISQNLGLQFTGHLNIYLASRPAEFGQLTGWKLPAWSQGVALTDRNVVVLKSPKYSGSRVDLAKAAVHEFVHILLSTDAGRIPLWLNEGLAVMLSGEGYFDDRPLTNASITGHFISFNQMEQVLKFDPASAQLAYQQALSAVRYLVAEFGWQAVAKILKGARSDQDFNRAFFDATGLWVDEFENEWLKKMGGKYKYSLLKDLNFLIGYLFIPLLLLGGLLAYIRRKRILRRWKEEEGYYEYGDRWDY